MNNPEIVFDPRLGGVGGIGSKYRDPKTGRFVIRLRRTAKRSEPREITFRCKYCGKTKPLGDMRMLTRFFPPLVACRECERRIG